MRLKETAYCTTNLYKQHLIYNKKLFIVYAEIGFCICGKWFAIGCGVLVITVFESL